MILTGLIRLAGFCRRWVLAPAILAGRLALIVYLYRPPEFCKEVAQGLRSILLTCSAALQLFFLLLGFWSDAQAFTAPTTSCRYFATASVCTVWLLCNPIGLGWELLVIILTLPRGSLFAVSSTVRYRHPSQKRQDQKTNVATSPKEKLALVDGYNDPMTEPPRKEKQPLATRFEQVEQFLREHSDISQQRRFSKATATPLVKGSK